MVYSVKEVYFTLQGEGENTGLPAVFLRFSGCNLWSGQESGRATAICNFCDTDFVGTDGPGGGRFADPSALAARVAECWAAHELTGAPPFVVCTGGEPLLQLDAAAIGALHEKGFRVAVETNGTIAAPPGIDWLCVSPKKGASLVQVSGDELKLVFPQPGLDPAVFAGLQFRHFYLQPMDGSRHHQNMAAASRYCRDHRGWQLSLQSHKYLGIP